MVKIPRVWTTGDLARYFGVELHTVTNAIRARDITPVGRAGKVRLYDARGARRIRTALAELRPKHMAGHPKRSAKLRNLMQRRTAELQARAKANPLSEVSTRVEEIRATISAWSDELREADALLEEAKQAARQAAEAEDEQTHFDVLADLFKERWTKGKAKKKGVRLQSFRLGAGCESGVRARPTKGGPCEGLPRVQRRPRPLSGDPSGERSPPPCPQPPGRRGSVVDDSGRASSSRRRDCSGSPHG